MGRLGLSRFRDFGKKLTKNSDNCCLNAPHQAHIKSTYTAHQVGESLIVIVPSLRLRRTDMLDVGESTPDVGEQTVGETPLKVYGNLDRTHRKVTVRLCSITEPIEQLFDRLGSIALD